METLGLLLDKLGVRWVGKVCGLVAVRKRCGLMLRVTVYDRMVY